MAKNKKRKNEVHDVTMVKFPSLNQRTATRTYLMSEQDRIREATFAGNTSKLALQASILKVYDPCKSGKIGVVREPLWALTHPEAYINDDNYSKLIEVINKDIALQEKINELKEFFPGYVAVTGCTRLSILRTNEAEIRTSYFEILDDRILNGVEYDKITKKLRENIEDDKNALKSLKSYLEIIIFSYNEDRRSQDLTETNCYSRKFLDGFFEVDTELNDFNLLTRISLAFQGKAKFYGGKKNLMQAYLFDQIRIDGRLSVSKTTKSANKTALVANFLADLLSPHTKITETAWIEKTLKHIGIEPQTLDMSNVDLCELADVLTILKGKNDVSYVALAVNKIVYSTGRFDILSILEELTPADIVKGGSIEEIAQYAIDKLEETGYSLSDLIHEILRIKPNWVME